MFFIKIRRRFVTICEFEQPRENPKTVGIHIFGKNIWKKNQEDLEEKNMREKQSRKVRKFRTKGLGLEGPNRPSPS